MGVTLVGARGRPLRLSCRGAASMKSARSSIYDYNSHMSRTSISGLKARLSHYLREVSRGGEVEILDRGVPVARLTRAAGSQLSVSSNERRGRLIKAGVLRQGEASPAKILEQAPLTLKTSILAALEEERADRL